MSSAPSPATPNGLLLVDKPQGITSHGVISRVRKAFGLKKVGHAGTLDPMATGLLLVGLGPATRLLTFLVGLDKEYVATIRLGASSTTDDAEGEILGYAPAEQMARVSDDDIHVGIASLTGTIMQVPSAVSAIKVDGKRAYARVREGEQVELQAREVTVSEFDILNIARIEGASHDDAMIAPIDVEVRVNCSSGTYIRALARDLGFRLGVGGHLTALRRTRVGPFSVGEAVATEGLALNLPELLTSSAVARALFESVTLTEIQATDLANGKKIRLPGQADSQAPVAAIDPADRLVGLVTVANEQARTIINFPPA